MIRRPPRSTRTDTLFPYTTLFRSQYQIGRATGLQRSDPVRDPKNAGWIDRDRRNRRVVWQATRHGITSAIAQLPRTMRGTTPRIEDDGYAGGVKPPGRVHRSSTFGEDARRICQRVHEDGAERRADLGGTRAEEDGSGT